MVLDIVKFEKSLPRFPSYTRQSQIQWSHLECLGDSWQKYRVWCTVYSPPCSNDSEHVQGLPVFISHAAAFHTKSPSQNEGQACELNDVKWEEEMRITIGNLRGLEVYHQKFHEKPSCGKKCECTELVVRSF